MGSVTINPRTVRHLREKRAWTQEQLAEVAKISLRTVQRIEKGKSVSFASIKAVAEALDIEVDKLKYEPQLNKEKETFLPRIMAGNELLSIIVGADFFKFHHDDLNSEDEVSLVSNFFDFLQDCDILDELGAGERVRVAFELGKMINELDSAGFWIFGKALTQKYPINVAGEFKILSGRTAVVKVVRKNNPEIIKKNAFTASLFDAIE